MQSNKKMNFLSVTVIAVLFLAVALMSISIVKNVYSDDEATTSPVVSDSASTVSTTSPTAPPTAQSVDPTTNHEPSTEQVNVMTTVPLPTQTQTDAPQTPEEICAFYNKAVNELKNYKNGIDIHKTEHIDLEIADFSLPAPMDAVNSIVKNVVPDTDAQYSYENGIVTDGSSQALFASIPPFTGAANVTVEDIVEAAAKKNSDGYLITISVLPDAADFDGTSATNAQHLSKVGNPVDFTTLDMGPLSISKASMKYHDVTVSVQTDSQGRVTVLSSTIPVNVTCTGGMGVFTADILMNIKVDTTYYVTYR